MGAIFLGLEGLESVSPIMLRRTLLELVAVRHALEGSRRVPLGRLLKDAGLPNSGRTASIVLRAMAQNGAVFVDHQDMYRTADLGGSRDIDVVIECDMRFVAKWVSKAGGGDHVYSLDSVPEDIRDKMAEELDDSIPKLKDRLPACPIIPDPDLGFRGRR